MTGLATASTLIAVEEEDEAVITRPSKMTMSGSMLVKRKSQRQLIPSDSSPIPPDDDDDENIEMGGRRRQLQRMDSKRMRMTEKEEDNDVDENHGDNDGPSTIVTSQQQQHIEQQQEHHQELLLDAAIKAVEGIDTSLSDHDQHSNNKDEITETNSRTGSSTCTKTTCSTLTTTTTTAATEGNIDDFITTYSTKEATTTAETEEEILLQREKFPVKLHALLDSYVIEWENKQKRHEHLWKEETTTEEQQQQHNHRNNKQREEEEAAAEAEIIPIVQWLSNGKSFKIHDSNRFAEELMPKYFPPNKNKNNCTQCSNDSCYIHNDNDDDSDPYYCDEKQQRMKPFEYFKRNLNLWGFNHMIFVEGGCNNSIHTVHICSHPLFVKGDRELSKEITFIGEHMIAGGGRGRRGSRAAVACLKSPIGGGGTTVGCNKDGTKFIINNVV